MKINKKIIVLLLLALLLGMAFYPLPQMEPNSYVERESGLVKTEKVAGERWLRWLYNNSVGEAAMFTLVKRKFLSSWYGNRMDSPSSSKKIAPFIEDYQIDMNIVQDQNYNSFNDFFIRKLKKDARPVDSTTNLVVSPADGKIMAFENISNTDFLVKGSRFNVSSFLDNTELAKKYINGSLIIIRLAPYDYHRFHFPVSGIISSPIIIDGYLYSVNPIAIKKMVEIFFLNKREYVEISTQQFGDVIMAEVGATRVGSIIQTYKGDNVIIGEEKGYFKFGGSTVVLLFEKNKIIIDNDLLNNTVAGLETEIKMGERIATVKLY